MKYLYLKGVNLQKPDQILKEYPKLLEIKDEEWVERQESWFENMIPGPIIRVGMFQVQVLGHCISGEESSIVCDCRAELVNNYRFLVKELRELKISNLKNLFIYNLNSYNNFSADAEVTLTRILANFKTLGLEKLTQFLLDTTMPVHEKIEVIDNLWTLEII